MALTVFNGGKDKSSARAELDVLGGDASFKTRIYETAEGTAMLRTKNGMPQVTVMKKPSAVATAVGKVLDFLSGVVLGGWITEGKTAAYYPTASSASKYGMRVGAPYASNRLAVRLDSSVGPASIDGSQYRDVRPSFYSGKMRALVQFVLGIGVVKHPSWYEINEALPEQVSSSYPNGAAVPVKYDYSFASSHGVVFGADGEPYLAHISQAYGVWLFLLPREFGTQSEAFGTAIADDAEGTLIWDQFKGFPTGESPAQDEFVSWLKSGCGFQLLRPDQMARYVESSALSTQLGWAFDYAGTEARVVGVKNIVGAAIDYYENSYMRVAFSVPSARGRNTSTIAVENGIKFTSVTRTKPWLRCKMEFMSDAQATALSAVSVANAAAWLEALDVAPITTPSAVFSTIEAAPLAVDAGVFKVWNPTLEICASLALPRKGIPYSPDTVVVDVFFGDDGPIEARFAKAQPTLSAGVFTAQYDTRALVAASSASETAWTSSVFGPKSITLKMYLDNVLEYFEKDWWVKQFKTISERADVSGLGAAYVPYGDREALIFAKLTTDAGGEDTKTYALSTIKDARAYVAATMFIGGSGIEEGTLVTSYGCTLPYNQDIFVRNDGLIRDGWGGPTNNGHGELTWPSDPNRYDGGPWSGPCEVITGTTWPVPEIPADAVSSVAPIGTFKVYFQTGRLLFPVISDAGVPSDMHYKYDVWFKPSAPSSDPQTLRAATNCLGPSATFQCYDDINSGSYVVFGDVINPLILTSNPCYIGVV